MDGVWLDELAAAEVVDDVRCDVDDCTDEVEEVTFVMEVVGLWWARDIEAVRSIFFFSVVYKIYL